MFDGCMLLIDYAWIAAIQEFKERPSTEANFSEERDEPEER
jgi:hypothetical protein